MRKSIRTVTLGVVLALTVLGMPSLSFADAISNTGGPYSVGDGWHSFSWTGTGATGGTQVEPAFTGTGPVTVKVTDAFVSGDRFSLSDNGKLVGLTSQLNGGPAPWTDNPNTAFASSLFSNGTFILGAGPHSLVLVDIQHPDGYPSGSAFVRFDDAGNGGNGGVASVGAPEPGTLVLVGMGLAGLVVGRVRRRFRKSPEAAIA
jgi:PEP-CTERM motif